MEVRITLRLLIRIMLKDLILFNFGGYTDNQDDGKIFDNTGSFRVSIFLNL